MEKMIAKTRPKNLDLRTIRLPLPGVVSILHRVSGAVLYLFGIPLLLLLLQYSLRSRESFEAVGAALAHPFSKLVLLGFAWAFWHHCCAGVRFLLLDVHKGVQIEAARTGSRWVLIVSLLLTALTGVFLW